MAELPHLDGWRDVPRQPDSLPGQRGLFDGMDEPKIVRRGEVNPREFRDRRAGQGFLFDELED